MLPLESSPNCACGNSQPIGNQKKRCNPTYLQCHVQTDKIRTGKSRIDTAVHDDGLSVEKGILVALPTVEQRRRCH
jgi:hypothetical protein